MSERLLVMHVLEQKLRESFRKGDLVDAQNIDAFLTSLEGMTDSDYIKLSSDCLAP